MRLTWYQLVEQVIETKLLKLRLMSVSHMRCHMGETI